MHYAFEFQSAVKVLVTRPGVLIFFLSVSITSLSVSSDSGREGEDVWHCAVLL